MALIPIFHGEVNAEGRLLLVETEAALRRVYLSRLAGHPVEVVIRKPRVQRSLDQNAYIHAIPVAMLADHFGYSDAEMKLVLMGGCWGWKHDPISGQHIPIKPSTSAMSVDECTHFIEWVIPWAMTEHGVAIPLPGEAVAA